MARADYPKNWNNLPHNINSLLTNLGDEKGVLTGLLALKALTKKYEYELEEGREPLYAIMEATFKNLGNLVNLLIQ